METPTDKSNPLRVRPGHHIRLELQYRSGAHEELEFHLVPDELACSEQGLLGLSTPLAQSILNEKAGILIPYFTDEIMALKILDITPGKFNLDTMHDLPMENILEDIRAQIEFREAQLFAASGNTKWGSYDPDGLNYETWKKSPGTATGEEKEDTGKTAL